MTSISSKLFTNEDKYHIHKFFGMYVLINFCHHYLKYFYNKENIYFNLFNLLPHFLLHISSFNFKVLPQRFLSPKFIMFIWEELRLHSMIFSYRALFILLFPQYRIPIIFLTMIAADAVTLLVGNENISTVRGDHGKESSSTIKKIYSSFFSTSQIGATIICGGFFQQSYSPMLVFATLPPIQTSAFGMTLLRKNIINKTTWQIIYSLELLFVYLIWYIETNNIIIIPLSILCYIARKSNISKYQIFIILTLINTLYNHIFNLYKNTLSYEYTEYE
jgi:hypothetical protein